MNDQDERDLQAILRALDTDDPQKLTEAGARELEELAALLTCATDAAPAPPVAPLFERLGLSDGAKPMPIDSKVLRPFEASWIRWALAATVVLMVGFAALAAVLDRRLERQAEQLAELERRFAWFEQTSADAEVAALQSAVRFLSSPGMIACGLEPMSPDQPDVRGTVYMNPQASRWMLTIDNLAPAPDGLLYRVWFVTESGPVNGGSFRVERGGGSVELGAEELPEGLRAVSVTVEPADAKDWPSGQQVLYGDEAREIL